MNTTEYTTTRNEMLQNFKFAEQFLVFSITIVGGLFYWLASLITTAENIFFSDPFIFVLIELTILSYAFFRYQHIHKRIYNQVSYLIAFYEISSISNEIKITLEASYKWHYLSRIHTSDWGKTGKVIGGLLFCLIVGAWFGPTYLLRSKMSTNGITLTVSIIITIFSSYIIYELWNLKKYMKANMYNWIRKNDKFTDTLVEWEKKFERAEYLKSIGIGEDNEEDIREDLKQKKLADKKFQKRIHKIIIKNFFESLTNNEE